MHATALGLSFSIVPALTLKDPVIMLPGATPTLPVLTVVSPPLNVTAVPAFTEKGAHDPRGIKMELVCATKSIEAIARTRIILDIMLAAGGVC